MSEMMSFRVTGAEAERIREDVKRSGLTFSEYIRRRVLGPEGNVSASLMTALEHETVELLSQVQRNMGEIARSVPRGECDTLIVAQDMHEVTHHVHAVQNWVLAQAAARAYPSRYRLMGGKL